MPHANCRSLALLVLISMPLAASAESYCPPVSSENIVAGTSGDEVTLKTEECTARFRQFLAETLAHVRAAYEPFLKDVSTDSTSIDELAQLIAREDLLATSWISTTVAVSHTQSASTARLLQETTAQLRAAMTPDDFAWFESYGQSLPTRDLLKPLISRFESAGIPLGTEQLDRAVQDVHRWSIGLTDRATEDGGDDIVSCEQADAFANRRDAQMLAVLAKSLDEPQALVARGYFQERAEQRDEQTAARRASAPDKPCTIVDF